MSSQKRKRSSSPANSKLTTKVARTLDPITVSSPITDRSSIFKAYFHPTTSSSSAPKLLQNHPDLATASHRILAWRRESNQQALTGSKTYITGTDDDGEKYAAKHVLRVLEEAQVEGVCVVGRWYGGVMLGPVRFVHIAECAKEAVGMWLARQDVERREREEEVERERLIGVLGRRDESILVLRGLVAEKERQMKEGQAGKTGGEEIIPRGADPESSAIPSPAKQIVQYDSFPILRLRTLEKARDATLAFLLKRIDAAETALAALKPASEQVETDLKVP